MSHLRWTFLAAATCVAAPAWAERVAVWVPEVSGGVSLASQGEHIASVLSERGYRAVSPSQVAARLGWDASYVGPEWAAQQLRSIDLARAALTRLDRRSASGTERTVARELVARGGGAGGSELLVEWCLLEYELASASGDGAGARLWLDRATSMGPNVVLDPTRHPSDELGQFEHRKVALANESPATFSVITTPPAADIWIDGVRRCTSPCNLRLPPGRHLFLLTLDRHAPTVLDLTFGPGVDAVRRIELPTAYGDAGTRELGGQLARSDRRGEASRALEPMARFLEVDQIVTVVPEGEGAIRVIVVPPAAGRSRVGPSVSERELDSAVLEQLRPTAMGAVSADRVWRGPDAKDAQDPQTSAGRDAPKPWYAKPGTWIAGGVAIGAILGAVWVYGATRPPTGTLTLSSPP